MIVGIFRLLFLFLLFLAIVNIVRLFIFLFKNLRGGQRRDKSAGWKQRRNNEQGKNKTIELDSDQYHVDE